jgi:hypothetical protein
MLEFIGGLVIGALGTAFIANRKPQWFASIQTIATNVGAQIQAEINKLNPPKA